MKLLIEVLLAFHFLPHLQGIKYLFQKHGFLSNALSFSQLVKIPNKFTQFERR